MPGAGSANNAPTAVLAPASGDEGLAITADASGSTDDGTITTYELDCDNDGTYEVSVATATGGTCMFDDDGSYTVGLQVTDDGGLTAATTEVFTVANVAPAVTAGGPASVDEGSPAAFTGSYTDQSPVDTHTFVWDFGDGNTDSANLNPTHTYGAPGSYTATLTVTDDDGGVGTATVAITVNDVAPVADAGQDVSANEGDAITFAGSVAGSYATVEWNFGDGTTDTSGLTPTHTFADDGNFTVTLTATDAGGLADSDTLLATIANVAPSITSTPTTTAVEDSQWSYMPTATDPGVNDVLTWSLGAGAPTWLTISPVGTITGTPPLGSYGTVSIVVNVDDGDGGTDTQTFTLTIDFLDNDNDGIADSWENDNGLDPNDPNDASADGDNDGQTNLDEFENGTDPNTFDGPTAPTLVAPIGDVIVTTAEPTLEFTNATDPQGDLLTYNVELYSDEQLTTLIEEITGIAEDGSGTTTTVPMPLSENQVVWWRAQAADPYTGGPWTDAEPFFVNEVNDEPDVPTLLFPIGGESVDVTRPLMEFAPFSDIDRDTDGTFTLEVQDDTGAVVTSMSVGAGLTEIQLDTDLMEDATYSWTMQAIDSEGLAGPWATSETFFVDTTNSAPEDVTFVRPTDGEEVLDGSPEFEASETSDVEGDAITYEFEVDSSAAFDAGDGAVGTVEYSGSGTVVWRLVDEGVVLAGGTWYARVRAVDARDAGSNWAEVSFVVPGSGDDDDDDDDGGSRAVGGCACESNVADGSTGPASLLWLMLALPVALRRRR